MNPTELQTKQQFVSWPKSNMHLDYNEALESFTPVFEVRQVAHTELFDMSAKCCGDSKQYGDFGL